MTERDLISKTIWTSATWLEGDSKETNNTDPTYTTQESKLTVKGKCFFDQGCKFCSSSTVNTDNILAQHKNLIFRFDRYYGMSACTLRRLFTFHKPFDTLISSTTQHRRFALGGARSVRRRPTRRQNYNESNTTGSFVGLKQSLRSPEPFITYIYCTSQVRWRFHEDNMGEQKHTINKLRIISSI